MKYSNTDTPAGTHRREQGFSMIEVLVTLLIISLALLGTAGLHAYAMRQNQAGVFRSQAVFLVDDLAERIEANKLVAVGGGYVVGQSSVPLVQSNACVVAACVGADLAAFDLAQWQNAVANTLPQSSWTVTQTTIGNPSVYTIQVGWVDRLVDTTNAAGAQTGVNAAGTGERFFYSATRTVFNN